MTEATHTFLEKERQGLVVAVLVSHRDAKLYKSRVPYWRLYTHALADWKLRVRLK